MIRPIVEYNLQLGKIKYYTPFESKRKEQRYFQHIDAMSLMYKKYLKPDFNCLDIGARDGDSLLPLFNVLDKWKSKIMCFEPNKEESQFIIKNAALNDFQNVVVYEYGISESTEMKTFLFDEEGRNGGLDTPHIHFGQWAETRSLPCVAPKDFDTGIKEFLKTVDFIKIDTEGSDIKILRLLMDYIQKPMILTEWWVGTELFIRDFVNEFHYRVYDPFTGLRLKGLDPTKRIDDILLIPYISEGEVIL